MFDLYFKGLNYCRPEAYYFWGYYFFMNFIWIVIPGSKSTHTQVSKPEVLTGTDLHILVLLYTSIAESAKAFTALDRQAKDQRGTGFVKKSN